MKTPRLLAGVLMAAAVSCGQAYATDGASNYQMRSAQAIKVLISATGPVTQAQYDAFWQTINPPSKQDKITAIDFLNRNFTYFSGFQREYWACTEEAWQKQLAIPCPKAQTYFDKIVTAYPASQRERFAQTRDNSERLLKAAAARAERVDLPDGRSLALSLQTIQMVRSNMDNAVSRIQAVLRPEFAK